MSKYGVFQTFSKRRTISGRAVLEKQTKRILVDDIDFRNLLIEVVLSTPELYQMEEIRQLAQGHITLDRAHSAVHDGDHFVATDSDGDVDTGAGNDKVWLLRTGSLEAHTIINVSATGAMTVSLYEGPTIDPVATPPEGSGVQLTTLNNNNRTSSRTPTATWWKDHTLTANGTLLWILHIGGNNPSTRIGGTGRTGAEWVLAPNTDYAIVVETDADNNDITVVVEFYEVER